MRKHGSVMGLALRMTWLPVLLVFAAVGVLQWLTFDPFSYFSWTFEMMLQNGSTFLNVALIGKTGAVALLIVLILSCMEFRGVKFTYTLQRLSLSERRVTWEFGLVFAGYYFLYWVFLLGMVFLLYWRYAQWAIPGQNLLFLAAYRSEYFHTLLPLKDCWGYVRNLLMCLSCGCGAALVSRQLRHGQKNVYPIVIPLILIAIFLPMSMASMGNDVVACIALIVSLIGYSWLLKWGDGHED